LNIVQTNVYLPDILIMVLLTQILVFLTTNTTAEA